MSGEPSQSFAPRASRRDSPATGSPAGAVPWRMITPVLIPAVVIIVAIFVAIGFARSGPVHLVLDNLHWTISYCTSAALAWMAVHHGAPARRAALRWYAIGLSGYAIGQILWDVQVASGWNPFPAPSDAFFLMLGLCFAIGLTRDIHALADGSSMRLVALDAGTFSIAALTMVLALYLPLRGTNSVLHMAVLIAYPLGLLTAACIGMIVVPALKLRADAGWLLFAGGLTLNGAIWMRWNAMTLAGELADGTVYNALFTVTALALGLGVARWDPTPVHDHQWQRRYDGLLRLMPLLAVVGASGALIVALTFAGVPRLVQAATGYGASLVLLLAFARQSLQLQERDRMIEMERQFRTLFDSAPEAILLMDSDRILNCNASAERLFGLPAKVLLSRSPVDLSPESQPDGRTSRDAARALIASALAGQPQSFRWRHVRMDGTPFDSEVALHRVDIPGRTLLQGVVRDITHRLEAEAKHLLLEDQLRQASRMEAVGRLAGGVAHDFNNILTVILGTSELALLRTGEHDPMRRDLEEVQHSAQRAAALTAQLLAFSRKQVIAPIPSDLNVLVDGALGMVRRLIGEDIELVFERGVPLATVLVDRTQFEQVLVNLAVNARDAMPKGGRLVVSTQVVEWTAAEIPKDSSARPGRFVRLVVTDNGTGIPADLLEHVFEPFFTTKEFGRGTGLGLSTVHGIVRQSEGFIEVTSTLEEGTKFSIHFPAVADLPQRLAPVEEGLPPRGSESILLVEDEPIVRELARRMLSDLGYTVLVASQGEEALQIAAGPDIRIDLLLTDVIMPGMSGKQLYEALAATRPGLPVAYMSGYTANTLAGHGVLSQETTLIQKPFALVELAVAVRNVLDRSADARIDWNTA